MTPLSVTAVPRTFGRHIPSLDGVRGLAILMVLGSHLFASNSAMSGPVVRVVGDALEYGLFGVDLFFVLSGFLITGVLLDSLADPGFFKNFYVRRALRIFPLYYGVLLVLFVLTPALSLHWRGMGWLFAFYLQTLRPHLLGSFSPGRGIGLNHFWSLAIEEQFYLAWPTVVFWVRDRRRLLVLTGIVSLAALLLRLVLVGYGVSGIAIHMCTFTRVDSLLLGGALSLIYRTSWWPRMLRLAPWGLAATVAMVLASIAFFGREFFPFPPYTLPMRLWIDGGRYTALALAGACLIACALSPQSWAERIFTARPMRFFGKYSYGIYVLHMLFLSFFLASQRAAIEHWTHSKLLAVVGAGVSTLCLSVGAAVVSFHFYEKPFLRLKQFFQYKPGRKIPGELRAFAPRRIARDLVSSGENGRVVSHR